MKITKIEVRSEFTDEQVEKMKLAGWKDRLIFDLNKPCIEVEYEETTRT